MDYWIVASALAVVLGWCAFIVCWFERRKGEDKWRKHLAAEEAECAKWKASYDTEHTARLRAESPNKTRAESPNKTLGTKPGKRA